MQITSLTDIKAIIYADADMQAAFAGDRAYINSGHGRTQLEAECPPEIVQQVYTVWGDTPIIEEPKTEYPAPVATPSTQDVINANIMARLATLEGVSNV